MQISTVPRSRKNLKISKFNGNVKVFVCFCWILRGGKESCKIQQNCEFRDLAFIMIDSKALKYVVIKYLHLMVPSRFNQNDVILDILMKYTIMTASGMVGICMGSGPCETPSPSLTSFKTVKQWPKECLSQVTKRFADQTLNKHSWGLKHETGWWISDGIVKGNSPFSVLP